MIGNARAAGVAPFALAVARPRIAGCNLARRTVVVRAGAEPKGDLGKAGTAAIAITGVVGPLLLDTGAAHAINRELGILEGQIFSLMHPAIMFFLFGSSLYAAYLGFQWRRTRELADEIKALKAQRAPASVGPDGQPIPAPPSPVDSIIKEKEAVSSRAACQLHGRTADLALTLWSLSYSAGAQGADRAASEREAQQLGISAAWARSFVLRFRSFQHIPSYWKALPRPPPVRWCCDHGAVGPCCSTRAIHAEG